MFFRSKIPESIVAMAYEPLLPLAEAGIQILLVPGNHERSRLPESPLFHHPNIHVFKQPDTVVLNSDGHRVAFGGFPFVRERIGPLFDGVLTETALLETEAELKILCMHQAIDGSCVGPVNFTFRKGNDVIGRDQIPKEIPLVLSGHLHRRQILNGPGELRVVYPGSIERTSFAEKDEAKGFYLIDIDVDPPSFSFEFVELDARNMEDIVLPENLSGSEEIHDYIQYGSMHIASDSILRIAATDQQLAVIKISEIRDLLPASMNVELRRPRP